MKFGWNFVLRVAAKGRVELLIDFWRRKWKRKKKTAKTEVLRLREKKG